MDALLLAEKDRRREKTSSSLLHRQHAIIFFPLELVLTGPAQAPCICMIRPGSSDESDESSMGRPYGPEERKSSSRVNGILKYMLRI